MDFTSAIVGEILSALLAGWYARLEMSDRRKRGKDAGRRPKAGRVRGEGGS